MMSKAVIVRVTETEFETEDGRVFPHPVPFEKGRTPTVGEFQQWYDHWHIHFKEHDIEEDKNG